MKKILTWIFISGFYCVQLKAQQRCSLANYLQLQGNPFLQTRISQIGEFTQRKVSASPQVNSRVNSVPSVIKIPVIFHVLYHLPEENLSDAKIQEQIDALNRDFRRTNTDTSLTPSAFKPLASDMEIEFQLAKSGPGGRSTSGITRKYTPVKEWTTDDKVKLNIEYGDDAWDSKYYLNIWICNLRSDLGYSTFPGGDAVKDGVVLDYTIVGNAGDGGQYSRGRTAVHEVGHWLNLKHIWGDTYCGDDNVDDTPKQSTYTPGCPSGVRSTCDNGPNGDMYMNYMDFTNDACMNMFTQGQKQRARKLFEPGGERNSILSSNGFDEPVVYESPLPVFYPRWLYANVYPNPTNSRVNIYFEYDNRWLGKQLQIIDVNGKVVMRKTINSSTQQIDVGKLNPGLYFIRGDNGYEKILQKFIKL